jgi:hypothetical protein
MKQYTFADLKQMLIEETSALIKQAAKLEDNYSLSGKDSLKLNRLKRDIDDAFAVKRWIANKIDEEEGIVQ